MNEPLPCPFCGGQFVSVIEGSTFRWRRVQCNDCGASTGDVRTQTMGKGKPTDWEVKATEDAIAEWNTRAALNVSAQ